MILVLLLVYVGLLMLAIKFNLIKPTLFWKLSPILWVVFLLIALFIPLQFGALVVHTDRPADSTNRT